MMSAVALSAGRADNLLENGSFESPAVTSRVPLDKGGDPAKAKPTGFELLEVQAGPEGGGLLTGLTNEIARTGEQSLFIDFRELTAPSRFVFLGTNLIPVKASHSYRISIWGRIDGKRPLALDERRPYLWTNMQFVKADRETESADSQLVLEMIPGRVIPGDVHKLYFVSWKWRESFTVVEIPEDTAFLRVTWIWGVPRDEGQTDGIVFWDDAAIEETVPIAPPATDPKSATPLSAPAEGAAAAPGKAPAAPAKAE